MGGTRIEVRWILFVFVVLTLLSLWPCIRCQDVDTDSYSQTGNPAVLPLITQVIYSRLSNLTTIFNGDITNSLGFCIKNVWVISDIPDFVSFWVWVSDNSLSFSLFCSWGYFLLFDKIGNSCSDADWNGAFNFSGNLNFLTDCIRQTKGRRFWDFENFKNEELGFVVFGRLGTKCFCMMVTLIMETSSQRVSHYKNSQRHQLIWSLTNMAAIPYITTALIMNHIIGWWS